MQVFPFSVAAAIIIAYTVIQVARFGYFQMMTGATLRGYVLIAVSVLAGVVVLGRGLNFPPIQMPDQSQDAQLGQ